MIVSRHIIRVFFALSLLSGFGAVSGRAETAADWLDYPPAFQSLFGNPVVVVVRHPVNVGSVSVTKVGTFSPRDGFGEVPTSNAIRVRAGATASAKEIRAQIAQGLANRFYSKVISQSARSWNEKKLNMSELVEMNREIFLDLAGKRLTGVSASSEILNTWWDVRMGNQLTPEPSYHLVIINIHYDYKGEKESAGHFCFALRKRGGSPDDQLYDFRAPWFEDRAPRATESVNIHNRLKLSAFTENLYDWLYTQTEYRNCYAKFWFLPVMKEQKQLLEHFRDLGQPHLAGNFRVFRKNCASLGLRFYDRIGPLSNPTPHGGRFSDMPVLASSRIVERFDNVPLVEIPNVTDKRGRAPTAKSKLWPAQPSRVGSPGYQILASDPRVN